MKVGFVTATHPEDHSVDLVMCEDGARLAGVQVMSSAASSRTGLNDLPDPGDPVSGDKWSLSDFRTGQDLVAVVCYIGKVPLVFGFLFPQVCQMLFARKNFRVDRHASDWYTSVDDAGNVELSHPSGTHLRIAESPDHEDLTGHDFDGKWKVDRNTTRAPWVSLIVKNAGVEKARLRVDPSGNVSLTNSGNLSATVGGGLSADVSGTTAVTSGGNATLTAPAINLSGATTITGTLHVTGASTLSAGLSVSGSMSNNGTNIGSTHTHTDPQGGTVGPPS